jgi:hypothetical protein
MNEVQPNFLSTLVVSFPLGEQRFAEQFNKGYQGRIRQPYRQLRQQELFTEMEILLSNLDLKQTVFRSDHASNYLILKGVLGKDKHTLLNQVQAAIQQPGVIPLRKEWQRGL